MADPKVPPLFETDETLPKFDLQRTIPQDVLDEAALKREEDKPDFGELWQIGQNQTHLAIAAIRNREAAGDPIDPEYRLPKADSEEWKLLTDGIAPEQWEEFQNATSQKSAHRIANQLRETNAEMERMAQAGGFKSVSALLGAGLTDPSMWGIGILTGGAAAEVQLIKNLSRAKKIATIAGLEGATNFTLEKYIQKSQYNSDNTAPLVAAGLGMLIGGGLAALSKQANGVVADAARDMTHGVDAAFGHDTAGAARATSGETPLVPEGAPQTDLRGASPLHAPQMTIAGQLTRSESATARDIGARAVEHPIGFEGHETAPVAATTRARLFATQRGVEFSRVAKPSFYAWFREQDLPAWKFFLPSTREAFFAEVSDAIDGAVAKSSAVKRMADTISENFRKTLEFAKQAGVEGADMITHAKDYLPRIWNTAKIKAAYARYGEGLERLFAKAMMEANADLDARIAAKAGKAMVTKLRRLEAGLDEGFVSPMSKQHIDDLRAYLKEWMGPNGDTISDAEVDSIMHVFERDVKPKGGENPRLKQRTLLDTETTMPVFNKETGSTEEISLKSLTERNAERLHNMYVRHLGGAAAWAKAGFKGKSDWDKMVRQVKAELDAAGVSKGETKATLENLDFLWRERTGTPHENDPLSLYARTARVLRAWNFARMMNQMGFAQLADSGNLIAYAGMKTLMQYTPEVLKFMRQARTGKLSSELMEEVEMVFGLGSEHLRSTISSHADSTDEILAHGHGAPGAYNRILDKADVVMSTAQKVTNQLSLFAPINTALHRMAGMAILHKFTKMALQGGEVNMKRMATIGLDRPMLDRITDQIKQFAVTKDSLMGGKKLVMTDVQNWADKEAADAFMHAVYANGRRIIQENDVGATHRWMHSTTGKILFQFRNFMMVAHTKQFLHNIHVSNPASLQDWETTMRFMLGGVSGMMVYAGRQYINTIGDKDRDKKLKERLHPMEVAKNGWAMSAWSGVIPAALDTAHMMTGGESPIFGYNRTSGLSSGILGNPTVDLVLLKLPASARLVRHALDPNAKVTKEDARNFIGTLFWSNATGIRNGLNMLQEDLPRKTQSTESLIRGRQ